KCTRTPSRLRRFRSDRWSRATAPFRPVGMAMFVRRESELFVSTRVRWTPDTSALSGLPRLIPRAAQRTTKGAAWGELMAAFFFLNIFKFGERDLPLDYQ